MGILIKQGWLDGHSQDILIEKNRISQIEDTIPDADIHQVIEAQGKAVLPAFYNAHTHAAMSLMRGYSDDLPVQQWLQEKIWPLEEHITEEDVYWGAQLACLEMIKSGTTFFNDMYWHFHSTARAVEEMGIRAVLSGVFIDLFDEEKARQQIKANEKLYQEIDRYSDRIQFALGPHAIYTVSEQSLLWAKEFADTHNCTIHLHLSESRDEVDNCVQKHGKRPVEYLADIGLLGPNLIATHCIWLSENETRLLGEHDVKIVHLPVSNMKLASGHFSYTKLRQAGLQIALGTDGCASNNNLDMIEEMKFASNLSKLDAMDPTSMPAQEILDMATLNGARMFGIEAGEIAVGKIADLILIDLQKVYMTPLHNLISNLVYAANGSCVDTTICDGKVLMQNQKVPGEDEILEQARRVAHDLVKRNSDR